MYTYTHDKHQHDLRQMQRSLAAAQHEAEVARKELHELRQSMIAALQHQIFLTGRIEGAAITGDRDVLSLQHMIDTLRRADTDQMLKLDHDQRVIPQGRGMKWF